MSNTVGILILAIALLGVITMPAMINMLERIPFNPFIYQRDFYYRWKEDLTWIGIVLALIGYTIILAPAAILGTIIYSGVSLIQWFIDLYFWIFRKRDK